MKIFKSFLLGMFIIGSVFSNAHAMNRELYSEMEEQMKEIEGSLQSNTNTIETFKRLTQDYMKKRKIVVDDLKKQLANNKMEVYKLKKEMEFLKKEIQDIKKVAEATKSLTTEKKDIKTVDNIVPISIVDNDSANKDEKIDILYIRKNKNKINSYFKDNVKKFSKDINNKKDDRIEASFILGNIYLTEKDYENASVFFSEAFKMDSKSIWAGKSMLRIGDSLKELNKVPSACNAYSQITSKQINSDDETIKAANKRYLENKCK